MNLQDAIRHGDMRWPQLMIVAICTLLMMIDGFESLMMAFVAPHLAPVWRLGTVEVGYLLSASVLGMALGAAFVSPLADRIGRRRHIVLCLVMMAGGMVLSGLSVDVTTLAASRVAAGIFIGAVVPSVNILVSEYCPDRRRGAVMGVFGVGLPLGTAIGGALTHPLVVAYGWRAPFFVAAAATAAILAVVLAGLPESIDYLVEKRPPGALAKLNAIARRLGAAPMAALPPPCEPRPAGGDLRSIVGGVMLRRTVCLVLGFTCLSAAFFFANTWTAKLVADASHDPALGIRAGVLIVVGGVIGALLFAALSLRWRPRLVTTGYAACGAVAFVLFASRIEQVPTALALAVAIGIFANGGMTAFYAISPSVYPTAVRATGVGWMVGFGRVAAILVPVVTGYLLKSGWTPAQFYAVFGGVLAVGAVFAGLLDRSYFDPGAADRPAAGHAPGGVRP